MPPSRREELIDSAMKVFYAHGFHNTGLDMVLAESNISRMTLYNHFKSKDELIVAALLRRDELFRSSLMDYVSKQPADPIKRLLAVFDWHEKWFTGKDFNGCMFINASSEFFEPSDPVRKVAAEHKSAILRYITERCEMANLKRPKELANQLMLLIEGAIVIAHIHGSTGHEGAKPDDAARTAKAAAKKLIDGAK